eukprot:evm.model.NODE_47095_length_13164_cov_15.790338.1
MTLHLLKEDPGQFFEDLDLTTTLLQPVRSFDPSYLPASSTSTSTGAAAAIPGNGSSSRSNSSRNPTYPMGPPSIEVLHSEEYMCPPPPTKISDRATGPTRAAAAAAAAPPPPPPTDAAPPPPPPSSPPPPALPLIIPSTIPPNDDKATSNRSDHTPSLLEPGPGLGGLNVGGNGIRYGFNRQYHDVFTHLTNEMIVLDVLRLPDPEHTPEEGEGGREDVREEGEEEDFDGDRYLGDMVGKDEDP